MPKPHPKLRPASAPLPSIDWPFSPPPPLSTVIERQSISISVSLVMETLPDKLTERIFDGLSLRDALNASHVSRAWNTHLVPYLRKTYNINRYFEQAFPQSSRLLEVFRESGTLLSGSRAYTFFLPSERRFTKDSDWDIYVPFPHFNLVKAELERQGFKTVPRNKEPHRPDLFEVFDFVNSSGHKVQANALTAAWNLHACLKNFHTTVVQNFISGRACCSIRWGPTFDKMGYFAKRINATEYQEKETRKWNGRGVKLVPFKSRKTVMGDSVSAFVVYWPSGGKRKAFEHIRSEQLGKRFEELH